MTELTEQKCTACRRGAPPATPEEVKRFMPLIPEWSIMEVEGVPRLARTFVFDDFVQALRFTNEIAALAEEEGHHPALLTEWGSVGVAWWTHKIRNLHVNDFIMAAKTDEAYGKR